MTKDSDLSNSDETLEEREALERILEAVHTAAQRLASAGEAR